MEDITDYFYPRQMDEYTLGGIHKAHVNTLLKVIQSEFSDGYDGRIYIIDCPKAEQDDLRLHLLELGDSFRANTKAERAINENILRYTVPLNYQGQCLNKMLDAAMCFSAIKEQVLNIKPRAKDALTITQVVAEPGKRGDISAKLNAYVRSFLSNDVCLNSATTNFETGTVTLELLRREDLKQLGHLCEKTPTQVQRTR